MSKLRLADLAQLVGTVLDLPKPTQIAPDRIKLRIEGDDLSLPDHDAPPPHECRAYGRRCVWAKCPAKFVKSCPLNHDKEWQEYNQRKGITQ